MVLKVYTLLPKSGIALLFTLEGTKSLHLILIQNVVVELKWRELDERQENKSRPAGK
ncbi:hypothetical protein JOC76_004567 [Neobacillus cucumis]|nr:hypothetical protein [Neobacillus cucumis]